MAPVEFLTARWDELEARENSKRSISPLTVVKCPCGDQAHLGNRLYRSGVLAEITPLQHGVVDHILRSPEEFESVEAQLPSAADPYMLADIAAKRAILKLHEAVPYYGLDRYGRWLPRTGEPKLWFCGYCQDDDGIINGQMPCETVGLFMLPFADHPDYQKDWAQP
jgi:hypothetical protein